jgi:alpha-amylase/alpha-mannosidase (GH57 family)
MQRYLCIHGHFYQPPRENPWLEAIEVQDSAHPYHDWNERITAECYAPNAASRILDGERRIERIVNNYAQISFNFGPTLLAWMEAKRPEVYRAILDADAESRARFSGHGSALAQAYHHSILPLANRRDKRTEILWGIADFERRFGRRPEGMWLPETAVDLESLDLMSEAGILFTILEPHQAGRVRAKSAKGKEAWRDVSGGRIDPSVPYEVKLDGGRRIAVFFYDGAISRAVAFEGLLTSGERFADRLMSTVPADPEEDRLVHIATDGETYGHHHRYGEMALSYALHHVEANGLARLTNYGEYLEAHPPEHEVEIVENTAWSCVHGVGRWREDCGCHTGGYPGWNQAWRAPLRQALDGLRDELTPLWEREAGKIFADPWAARDAAVDPALVTAGLTGEERARALNLLELQRHALLMYTSCGWFFNDLGGIETVQILRYAGRVVQLARELLGADAEPALLRRLETAKSNLPITGSGRDLYERLVRPSMVEPRQVAAHYAVSALFEDYPNPAPIYCYSVERDDGRAFRAGRSRLSIGRVRVTSGLTGETAAFAYGVLHFGDHNLNAGVIPWTEDSEGYEALTLEAGAAFEHGDLPQVVRLLDRYFGGMPFSLRSLFRDEQRRVLDRILASTLAEVEGEFRQIYAQHAPLMRFLKTLGTPLPKAFAAAAELVLSVDLRRAVAAPEIDAEAVARLLASRAALGVELDVQDLSFALQGALDARMDKLRESPTDPDLLQRADTTVALARTPPFDVDLWRAQNGCYELLRTVYPEQLEKAGGGDGAAEEWIGWFRRLAERLAVRVG